MKKRIALALMLVMAALLLASCGNKAGLNSVNTYHKAVITMPDGEVVCGAVQEWKGFAYSDVLQVKIEGINYLVHSSNVVLMNIP